MNKHFLDVNKVFFLLLIVTFITPIIAGCSKEQKVIFECQSVSSTSGGALYSYLVQRECAKQSESLSNYLKEGWKVVASSQKEKMVLYDYGICIGTEYIIEKSVPLFAKNSSIDETRSIQPRDTATSKESTLKGTVKDIYVSGGYTYISLTNGNDENKWLATPEMKIDKGNIIECSETDPIYDFQSKTLNKKFDKIYFVTDIRIIK